MRLKIGRDPPPRAFFVSKSSPLILDALISIRSTPTHPALLLLRPLATMSCFAASVQLLASYWGSLSPDQLVFGQIRLALETSGLTLLSSASPQHDDDAQEEMRGRSGAGPEMSPFDTLCARLLASAEDPASATGVGSALSLLCLQWIEAGGGAATQELIEVRPMT